MMEVQDAHGAQAEVCCDPRVRCATESEGRSKRTPCAAGVSPVCVFYVAHLIRSWVAVPPAQQCPQSHW